MFCLLNINFLQFVKELWLFFEVRISFPFNIFIAFDQIMHIPGVINKFESF